jgi:lipopolysaccharide export system permease protein
MYRDSEMVALSASGFSDARLFRSVLFAAVPMAVLVGVLVMELLPWARANVTELRETHAQKMDVSAVRPGRFNEFSRGGLVVYTEQLSEDGMQLSGVFLQDRQQGKLGLVMAESARQTVDAETGERFVVLTNGRRYEGQPGDLAFTVASFDQYAIRLPTLAAASYRLPISAKSWQELVASDNPRDIAEFQFRLSVPLALIAFAVLAVPLARSPPRAGIYGRLLVALLLYFTFMNLQRVAEEWLEDGVLPTWLGMWWLPLLMLCVAGLIMLVDSNWFAVQRRRWRVSAA